MTDDTVTEAKGKFDLKARLQGRGLRTGEITLYLDEINGEKLGYARNIKNNLGFFIERVRVGVIGEIDGLDEKSETYAADLERLGTERDALIETIKESGIVVKLSAVPPVIAKSHERQARKQLNIKGKPSEEEQAAITEVQFTLLFVDVIESVIDGDGSETGKLDYDNAKGLADYLPIGQLNRLRDKVIDVQFGDVIDESVTSDSDF